MFSFNEIPNGVLIGLIVAAILAIGGAIITFLYRPLKRKFALLYKLRIANSNTRVLDT